MLPPIWLALHGHWLWWAALAGALAGGWLLERALRRKRSRRAWRARASALLRARPEDEPAASLTGTLRVEGAAAHRFEDGAPAAAASAAAGPRADRDAACVSVRAERVWLDTRDGPIELCGPIEVVGGRVVRTAGAPIGQAWARLSAALGNEPDWPFTSLPVELRSVAPGERVEALGVLERARDDEAAGYRSAMRRVLVSCEGAVLVAPTAQAPVRAWRGPLVAVFLFAVVNAIVTRGPERWDREVGVMALVNPVTRPRALEILAEAIPADAEDALTDGSRISPHAVALAVALTPEMSCADHARLLRASGQLEEVLRMPSRCVARAREERPAPLLRERVLALYELGREDDAVQAWDHLIGVVDAACVRDGACDLAAMELARYPSALDWDLLLASSAPIDLFLGRRLHRSSLRVASFLVERLRWISVRSDRVRHARILWTLELAAMELDHDALDSAEELASRARNYVAAGHAPARIEHRLYRAADHITALALLRRGDSVTARAVVHEWEGGLPCPLRVVVAAATDPLGSEAEAMTTYRFDLEGARDAMRAGDVTSFAPITREGLVWVDALARTLRYRSEPRSGDARLAARLGEPRSRRGAPSFRDAAWDASLARAYEALGETERAARIREHVRRARADLLARPPLERYR